MPINTHENLRPRDLAMMLLASGDLLPRQRARDQQADLAGAELKRRVLSHVVELDPEPSELAAVLDKIVRGIGEPAGPTRAIAAGVLEEFDSARTTPELFAWLLDQAAQQPERK